MLRSVEAGAEPLAVFIVFRLFDSVLHSLKDPSSRAPLPLVYVEGDGNDPVDEFGAVNKRSGRYYRRYPWKRQNTRSRT